MSTQCNTKQIEFLPFKSLETSGNGPGSKRTRKVIAKFDSDKVSSDGGIVLLREAEHRFGVIRRFAECFIDHRNPSYITHPVFSIVAQRVLAICFRLRRRKRPRQVPRGSHSGDVLRHFLRPCGQEHGKPHGAHHRGDGSLQEDRGGLRGD